MNENGEFSRPQVDKEHYFNLDYLSSGRWFNYFLQIKNVLSVTKRGDKILEIGKGNGIVSDILKKMDLEIKTLDIDKRLDPDVVSSIIETPFPDNEFEVVLVAEVLEHLPFNFLRKALAEIHRITKKYAVISLPHRGVVFKINIKVPLVKEFFIFFKIPYLWKKHSFDGQHYWEIGKRDFPLKKIREEMVSAGWFIKNELMDKNDPSHWHCLLEKK